MLEKFKQDCDSRDPCNCLCRAEHSFTFCTLAFRDFYQRQPHNPLPWAILLHPELSQSIKVYPTTHPAVTMLEVRILFQSSLGRVHTHLFLCQCCSSFNFPPWCLLLPTPYRMFSYTQCYHTPSWFSFYWVKWAKPYGFLTNGLFLCPSQFAPSSSSSDIVFLSSFKISRNSKYAAEKNARCKGLVGKKNRFLILFLIMPSVQSKYFVTTQREKQNNII